MAKMKWYDWTAVVLLAAGGINWGLVGFFEFNLVEKVFGSVPVLVKVVYGGVAASALYSLKLFFK